MPLLQEGFSCQAPTAWRPTSRSTTNQLYPNFIIPAAPRIITQLRLMINDKSPIQWNPA